MSNESNSLPSGPITLRGKTRKGQNRITQFGTQWSIIEIRDKVKFDNGPGPWLLLLPVGSDKGTRWIHQDNDPDFEIVK